MDIGKEDLDRLAIKLDKAKEDAQLAEKRVAEYNVEDELNSLEFSRKLAQQNLNIAMTSMANMNKNREYLLLDIFMI